MLMMLFMWLSLFLTATFSPKKHLWALVTGQGFVSALLSISWIFLQDFHSSNTLFFIDKISAPLAILTCWLFPLTTLASQNKLRLQPIARQRLYIINSILLQLTTLLAFTASDFMLFFVFFEASLIPTMIIITRWGTQKRRLEAGMYLAFYTMMGAMPLLLWINSLYLSHGSLLFPLTNTLNYTQTIKNHPEMFWLLVNIAFLIKLPVFSFHQWLPKAHVEAPIAGSMILAGTLLKLGGYGLLRTAPLLQDYNTCHYLMMILIATFGILSAASLCLRQNDLKTLIAMSSVSHMNLVLVAALLKTPTSYSGAVMLMIAHGLTSSALFCLANTAYDRTNSRTVIMLRGALLILPLSWAWWLTIILFNMSLPPTINFVSELQLMVPILSWSTTAFILIAFSLILTTSYTLLILWTQRGPLPQHLKTLFPFTAREHTLLATHIAPALLLIFNPNLIF